MFPLLSRQSITSFQPSLNAHVPRTGLEIQRENNCQVRYDESEEHHE